MDFFEQMEARIPHGKVRTRFAPSPTGYMHVGNLRRKIKMGIRIHNKNIPYYYILTWEKVKKKSISRCFFAGKVIP